MHWPSNRLDLLALRSIGTIALSAPVLVHFWCRQHGRDSELTPLDICTHLSRGFCTQAVSWNRRIGNEVADAGCKLFFRKALASLTRSFSLADAADTCFLSFPLSLPLFCAEQPQTCHKHRSRVPCGEAETLALSWRMRSTSEGIMFAPSCVFLCLCFSLIYSCAVSWFRYLSRCQSTSVFWACVLPSVACMHFFIDSTPTTPRPALQCASL